MSIRYLSVGANNDHRNAPQSMEIQKLDECKELQSNLQKTISNLTNSIHKFHETCDSVTFYFMKQESADC